MNVNNNGPIEPGSGDILAGRVNPAGGVPFAATMNAELIASALQSLRPGQSIVVGRSPGEGGVKLTGDLDVSRTHARFTRNEDGTLTGQDLGSMNGTHLRRDGQNTLLPQEHPQPLQVGDEVRIGQAVVRIASDLLRGPGPAAAQAQQAGATELVRDTPILMHALAALRPGDSVVIGRGRQEEFSTQFKEGAVLLAHGDVSRTHATVTRGMDTLSVKDEGSTNGTWLTRNGQVSRLPAHTPTALQPGDHVSLAGGPGFTVTPEMVSAHPGGGASVQASPARPGAGRPLSRDEAVESDSMHLADRIELMASGSGFGTLAVGSGVIGQALKLESPGIGPTHALINKNPANIWSVTDLEAGGTFVHRGRSATRVPPGAEFGLLPRDRVTFGAHDGPGFIVPSSARTPNPPGG